MKPDGRNDFEDFLNGNPTYSGLRGNAMAETAFEELSRIPSIYKMTAASNAGEPAISACIGDIERLLGQQSQFDLNSNFNKQALGRMVKTILEPFGYSRVSRKRIRKGLSNFVTSAAVYSQDNQCPARLDLVVELSVRKRENGVHESSISGASK
jgi:hypothetical protein